MISNRRGSSEIFTIQARRCRRCGGLLTSRQALEDGYGHVCKIKAFEERAAKEPLDGQISLFEAGMKKEM